MEGLVHVPSPNFDSRPDGAGVSLIVIHAISLPPDRFGDNTLFVAINLDPHHAHESDIELPLWQWGLPDHGALMAENLVTTQRTVWRGKWQHIRLAPEQPFAIWRVRPALPSEEQPS